MSLVINLKASLDGFHIDIPKWEISDSGISALCGPSGAGKTSVFRLLAGLEKADPGFQWSFGGEDLAKLDPGNRRLGVIFQSYDLFPHMTAEENIRFAAKVRGIRGEEYQSRLGKFAKKLQIEKILERPSTVLSGGEQQRVAMIRALISRPRILLLDEPFAALDENLRAESRDLVRDLVLEEGIPAILVSHDKRDIESLAASVTYIENGRLKSGHL